MGKAGKMKDKVEDRLRERAVSDGVVGDRVVCKRVVCDRVGCERCVVRKKCL